MSGEDERKTSPSVDGNTVLNMNHGNQYQSPSRRIKIELPYYSFIILQDIYLSNQNTKNDGTCIQCSLSSVYTIAK